MFRTKFILSMILLIILTIAVLLFFFWRWLFKKLEAAKSSKTSLYSILIASVAMAPLMYIAFIFCFIFISTYYPDRKFDRDVWLNDKGVRYEYTYSLRNDSILNGKTKEQVKEYLGEPDVETQNSLTYFIGTKPAVFNLDLDYLKILFENDSVSEIIERST